MDAGGLDTPRLALALVEAQVGPLVDVLPVALLVADARGRVLRANDAASELLEQPTLVGRCVDDVLSRHRQLEVRQRRLAQGEDELRLFVLHSR